MGHGHYNDAEAPEQVAGLKGKHVIDISCGGYHTLCITEENEIVNTVYAFGAGYKGQLGNGEDLDSSVPVEVNFKSMNVELGGNRQGDPRESR